MTYNIYYISFTYHYRVDWSAQVSAVLSWNAFDVISY